MPQWLYGLAIISLVTSGICTLIITIDIFPNNPVFWFMMQIGMVCGFLTSYPVNWWLLSKKIKEVM
ncbi:DUF4396 domain-containing protein [Calothrix sp. NIES-2098]|uniref:DUF4396 domain-containing protein n=1 Tax=Calothrix sp. NIES-2098 TaxID=1954171 RepID=UPI000B5DE5B5|nr:hypothetical protein NIES2098_31770 [Calothrix sp. NIES-2098]